MKLRSSSLRSSGDKSLDGKVFDLFRKHNCTVLAAGAATPVLGPELVTNGDFSNGTTGWEPQATATLSVSGGMMEITCTGAGYGTAARTVSLVIGKTYWLQASSPDSGVAVRINNATSGSPLASLALTSSPTFVLYTATEATVSVAMHANSNVAGTKRKFGQITLKEFSGYTYGNPPFRNYFDSVGTDILDSVTQVDQPVGLALDAAGTVGPELNPDTTFSNPASWSESNADATHYSVISGNTLRYVSGTITPVFSVTGPLGVLPVGTYEVVVTCSQWTSGSVKLFDVSGTGPVVVGGTGTVRQIVTITTQTALSFARNTANVDMTFSMVSVKRIPGQHATQATVGSKPTLRRGLVNQLLWSGDFSNAAWAKTGASISSVVSGSLTVSKLTEAATGGTHCVAQSFASVSGDNTFTVRLKAGGRNFAAIECSGQFAYFDLASGTVGFQNSAVGNIQPDGDGWYLCSITFTAIAGAKVFTVYASATSASSGASYAGDGTSGILLHRAALYQGTVTAQQILAAGGIPLTTTAPASSALGNYWFQFDPAAPGDYFNTGISTGEAGWICAGVNFQAAANVNETVCSSGAGSATQKGIWLVRNGIGGAENNLRMGVGNGTELTMPTVIYPGLRNSPRVVEGGWDASLVFAGVDGTIVSLPRTGSATPPANSLNIGCFFPGTHHLSGGMSVQVICPTLPPPADRALIRAWVASRQGQKL